jgi:hypothetical protein
MRSQMYGWLRGRRSGSKSVRPVHILEAVAALRAGGLTVTPHTDKDDFQHWRLGDLMMTEAAVVQFAVSRGLIGDR